MKKLVIAAAIAMAAVISQASAVNWQTAAIKDHAGANVGTSASFTAVCTIWDATGANVLYTTSPAVKGDFFSAFKGSWDGAAANTTYQAQLVITDASGWELKSEKAAFTTNAADPFAINFTTGGGFSTETAKLVNTGANNGWQAVPEPTSGLLLLLGMAGLALRRRRA